MAKKISLRTTMSIDGVSHNRQVSTEVNGIEDISVSLAAALAGTLTTRTDNDTGVITLASGHGILTSDFISMAWLDPTTGLRKYRYNVDITAVSGTTISTDIGSGDNNPLVNADVIVYKRRASDAVLCSILGLASAWTALNLGSDDECLAVFHFAGDGGSIAAAAYAALLPKSTGRNFVASMMQLTINAWNALTGSAPNASCDLYSLTSVDFYNFVTKANKVDLQIAP